MLSEAPASINGRPVTDASHAASSTADQSSAAPENGTITGPSPGTPINRPTSQGASARIEITRWSAIPHAVASITARSTSWVAARREMSVPTSVEVKTAERAVTPRATMTARNRLRFAAPSVSRAASSTSIAMISSRLLTEAICAPSSATGAIVPPASAATMIDRIGVAAETG